MGDNNRRDRTPRVALVAKVMRQAEQEGQKMIAAGAEPAAVRAAIAKLSETAKTLKSPGTYDAAVGLRAYYQEGRAT